VAEDEPQATGESQWLPPTAPGAQSAPIAPPPPAAPAPVAAPPVSQATPPAGAPPPGQPLGPLPPAPPGPPGNDRAVLALVLGIGGLVAFLGARLGLLFFLNLPPSIAAWVIGVQARRRVDRGETDQHRGVAQAGLVMGVIGTVLGLLAIVGWTLALTMSEDARRFLGVGD
jgi:hypothetical protein